MKFQEDENMNSCIFCNITLCSSFTVNRCVEAEQSSAYCLLLDGLLLSLFLDPEDGGDVFLQMAVAFNGLNCVGI
jgi:hypothetical protein